MRYYVKVGSLYYEFNTTFDVFSNEVGMNAAELMEHVRADPYDTRDPVQILQELDCRGTTTEHAANAQEAVECNSMGPDWTALTWDQIVEKYGTLNSASVIPPPLAEAWAKQFVEALEENKQ